MKKFRFKLYRFIPRATGEVVTVEIKARSAHAAYKAAERLCLEGGPGLGWQYDPNEECELDLAADIQEFGEVADEEPSEN